LSGKILTTVEAENWASLAEVSVAVDGDSITIGLEGPDGSIAATDPMCLRLTIRDAVDLHRQLGVALGSDRAIALGDTLADLRAAIDERDRALRELQEARSYLLGDEERRKLTGDALQAVAELAAECEVSDARAAEVEALRWAIDESGVLDQRHEAIKQQLIAAAKRKLDGKGPA
jgi:hypothetical protein